MSHTRIAETATPTRKMMRKTLLIWGPRSERRGDWGYKMRIMVCCLFGLRLYASQAVIPRVDQVINVDINIDHSQSIPMNQVPADDLMNYRFFGIKASPSDSYFPVERALYKEIFSKAGYHGNQYYEAGSYTKTGNLVGKIPHIFLKFTKNRENPKKTKDMFFPRYIPHSFIEKLEKQSRLNHTVGVTKKQNIILAYTIENIQKKVAEVGLKPEVGLETIELEEEINKKHDEPNLGVNQIAINQVGFCDSLLSLSFLLNLFCPQ